MSELCPSENEKALEMSDSVCVLARAMNSCMKIHTGRSEKYLDMSPDVRICYSLVLSAEVCLKNEGIEEVHFKILQDYSDYFLPFKRRVY